MLPLNLHSTLDYRVHVTWAWQLLRCFNIFGSALLIAWNVKFVRLRWSGIDRTRAVFFSGFGLYVALQESEQIGQPVLVWRAPLLAMLVILGLALQWRRAHSDVPL